MTMYLEWNKMIEPQADERYRLEDMQHPEAIKELLSVLGYQRPLSECEHVASTLEPMNQSGTSYTPPTWNDLPDGELRVRLQQMASAYGYLEDSAHGRNDQQS